MNREDKTVIVIGGSVTTLSTLRCLRKLKSNGFRLILFTRDKSHNVVKYSRIPNEKHVYNGNLVDFLMAKASGFQHRPCLLFTSDADVHEVGAEREKLKPYYRFLLPNQSQIEALNKKDKFMDFATRNNLTIPKTIKIQNPKQLAEINLDLQFPIIVKPYLKHAVKINSKEALDLLIKQLKNSHYQAMVAQEYIEGSDDQLYFCLMLFDAQNRLVRSVFARKLRQWPLQHGTTSLAITIQSSALAEEVEKFCNSLKIQGYCSVEYKYDIRNGKYYIMEPTLGRFNQQIALSEASGANIPLAMVQLLYSEPVAPKDSTADVYWSYESNDLFSYLKSKTRYPFFRLLFLKRTKVLFSIFDPLPFFAEWWFLGQKKLNKLLSNV